MKSPHRESLNLTVLQTCHDCLSVFDDALSRSAARVLTSAITRYPKGPRSRGFFSEEIAKLDKLRQKASEERLTLVISMAMYALRKATGLRADDASLREAFDAFHSRYSWLMNT